MEPARAIWRWASRENPAALAVAWVGGVKGSVSAAREGGRAEKACGRVHAGRRTCAAKACAAADPLFSIETRGGIAPALMILP